MQTSRWRENLLALVAGAVMPLAFAPVSLFPFSLLSLALLFNLWLNNPAARRSAVLGFYFGIGLFAVGVSWVFVSMHNFGNMSAPLAVFATVLFIAPLALYVAAVGWLQAQFSSMPAFWRLLLVMPSLWVLVEWIRSWLLTGFPWLTVGYSQTTLPLSGYAIWLGVFGVSFMVAGSAGLLLMWWRRGWRSGWRFGAVLLALWIGGAVSSLPGWVSPAGNPVRVALVQGNVPLKIKWDPNYRKDILDLYLRLSRDYRDADLIVWPEGALPLALEKMPPGFEKSVRAEARNFKTDFLFGTVSQQVIEGRLQYFNTVASIGRVDGQYRKRHLVPFGEYPPLKPLFSWLLNAMNIPMSDFSRGDDDQRPLQLAGNPVGISVCYETAFGNEIIDVLPEATMLINVSENAWFGRSFGPHQLLQMTQMRAIETGRPIMRADNAGLSAAVDHRGRVVAVSPQFQQSVLAVSVQPMTGSTPYVRFGDWPIITLMLLLLTGLWWRKNTH
ncbi:MAG: apolipoprotein N-acyltransferase [Acidiferrobacterales bacterium]